MHVCIILPNQQELSGSRNLESINSPEPKRFLAVLLLPELGDCVSAVRLPAPAGLVFFTTAVFIMSLGIPADSALYLALER